MKLLAAIVGIPDLGGDGVSEVVGVIFGVAILVAVYIWWNHTMNKD
jgi:hypothetical protein